VGQKTRAAQLARQSALALALEGMTEAPKHGAYQSANHATASKAQPARDLIVAPHEPTPRQTAQKTAESGGALGRARIASKNPWLIPFFEGFPKTAVSGAVRASREHERNQAERGTFGPSGGPDRIRSSGQEGKPWDAVGHGTEKPWWRACLKVASSKQNHRNYFALRLFSW